MKQELRDRISQARARGQLAQVVNLTARLLRITPSDTKLRAQYALDLRNSGDFRAAVAELDLLIREEPENPSHLTGKGVNLADMGKFAEALQVSLAAARNDALAWLNVSRICRQQGDQMRAKDALETCVEVLPENLLARNSLNMLLYDLGDEEGSLHHGLQALQLKDRKSCREFADLYGAAGLQRMPERANPSGKNVVSFSLWGDRYMYLQGAVENARLMPGHYPGWVCRIYHDASVPDTALRRLRELGAELVVVDGVLANLHGGLWRFAVANDPAVHRFIVRDADGRLNERDVSAVTAWQQSGKRFHIMRDHAYHTDLILAGMWGGMAAALPDLTDLANRLYGGHASRWNDQLFLANTVWPLVRDDCLIHDSFYHQGFRGDPFPPEPPRTDENYIGRGVQLNGMMTSLKVRVPRRPNRSLQ